MRADGRPEVGWHCPNITGRSVQLGPCPLIERKAMAQENTGETVRRTLMLLRKISEYRGQWFRLTDLANRTGLPKSTLHRFLAVFCEENILEKNEIVPGAYRYKRIEQK